MVIFNRTGYLTQSGFDKLNQSELVFQQIRTLKLFNKFSTKNGNGSLSFKKKIKVE